MTFLAEIMMSSQYTIYTYTQINRVAGVQEVKMIQNFRGWIHSKMVFKTSQTFGGGMEKWIMLIRKLFLNCTIKVLSLWQWVHSSHCLSQALKLTYYVLTTPIFMSWLLSIYYIFKHDIGNTCTYIRDKSVHKITIKFCHTYAPKCEGAWVNSENII